MQLPQRSQTVFNRTIPQLLLASTSPTPQFSSRNVPAGTNLSLPENYVTCGTSCQAVTADICRIALDVATLTASGISMKAWAGRFLGTGNGGLAAVSSNLVMLNLISLY